MRERYGILLAIDRELNPLEVKGLAVQYVHRSVNNGLPDAAGEPVHPFPLLMSFELAEGLQGVSSGVLL